MFQAKNCRKNQNTHYVFINVFPNFVPLVRQCGIYGRAGQTTGDSIITAMRLTCSITKATNNTFRMCNTYCFSTAKMVTLAPLDVTRIRTLPVFLFLRNKGRQWLTCADMAQLLQPSRWNMRKGCKAEAWLYPRFEEFNMTTMFPDRIS
jgi:hypothetical protein